jgi:hypothetical protein
MAAMGEKGVVMRGFPLAAYGLLVLLLMPWNPAWAQATAAEILVGYNSEADRKAAETELAASKDRLKVRGQNLESLRVQAISDKALRLQVGLPAALKAEIAKTPSAEAAILTELASQLKRADKRIVYAHPNWILSGPMPIPRGGVAPVERREAAGPQPKETASAPRKEAAAAPERKEASAAPDRKHDKRVAKKTKARVAHKGRRAKLASARRCRCWQEAAWVAPCSVRHKAAWRVARWR